MGLPLTFNADAGDVQNDGVSPRSYTGVFYVAESIKDKLRFTNVILNNGCSVDEWSDYKLQLSCVSGKSIYVELSNNASIYFGNPILGKAKAIYECKVQYSDDRIMSDFSKCYYNTKEVNPCTNTHYLDYKDPLSTLGTRSFVVKDATYSCVKKGS